MWLLFIYVARSNAERASRLANALARNGSLKSCLAGCPAVLFATTGTYILSPYCNAPCNAPSSSSNVQVTFLHRSRWSTS